MGKNGDMFEGFSLTNGLPVSEWIDSLPTSYERERAKTVVQSFIEKGERLSEIKLKLAMSSGKRSTRTYEHRHEDTTSTPTNAFVERRPKRRGCIIASIAIMVIIVIAIVSNPSLESHQELVGQTLTSIAKREMYGKAQENPLVFLFGDFVKNAVDAIVCSSLNYNNYILFSTSSVERDGKHKIVSIGVLGKVFVLSENEIVEKAKEEWPNKND